jgi:bacteriocin biosynthesis cyclodehydratase domain-containing protein
METIRNDRALSDQVQVVSVGTFGKAVAGYLAKLCSNVEQLDWTGTASLDRNAWSAPKVRILAAWRPVPELCSFWDGLSHQNAHPFIPVIIDSAALCVGPVIVPAAKSGCWQCWQLRSQQHTKDRQERRALLQFYETNPSVGPAGYLESFALIGAAQVASAIQSADHLRQAAGKIWQIDIFTRAVSVGYLIGVDGCSRCGMGRPLQDRSWADIRHKLAFMWSDSLQDTKSDTDEPGQ